MQTNVRTPTEIFNQPQRLLVPLFQRPYVWTEEKQWEPLWGDVERVAGRLLVSGADGLQPHFLGAVVIQQIQNPVGDLQTRIVIDGQQRLTTLQILLDAVHSVFEVRGFTHAAARLAYLVENAEAFRRNPEDRFKVWPTNRDRAAFNEVMGVKPPIDYSALKHASSRLVHAHQFFVQQTEGWLAEESIYPEAVRADALETAISKLLQLVVIDLQVDENAQEIFETLNARGTPLTPVDLIKNFVFQRLSEEGADVEKIYNEYWKLYETPFWEEEILSGRLRRPRAVVFFNHWLFSMLGEDVTSSEVFATFKRFLLDRPELGTLDLVKRIYRSALVYEDIIRKGQNTQGDIDRVGIFAYRAEAMQTDVVKPLLLALLDEESHTKIPPSVVDECIEVIESWLVRRMLIRVGTKSHARFMADLVTLVRNSVPEEMVEKLRDLLLRQRADASYWPDDTMVRRGLANMQAYRRLSRSRLRMILEAVEDYLRGYSTGKQGLTGVRTPRGAFTIEHLMPQLWESNWSEPADGDVQSRKERIHTLGNLTLVTQALNSKVSNSAWTSKVHALNEHGVVLMNSKLIAQAPIEWTDQDIERRTQALIEIILQIWKVPEGHVIETFATDVADHTDISVADMMEAGILKEGDILVPSYRKLQEQTATLLADGFIRVDGQVFATPSGAGAYLRDGKATNGYSFWLVGSSDGPSLRNLRRKYYEMLQAGQDIDQDSLDDLFEIVETESQRDVQLRFWEGFVEHVFACGRPFSTKSPRRQSWMSIAIGRTGVHVDAVFTSNIGTMAAVRPDDVGPEIRVDLIIWKNIDVFEELRAQGDDIMDEYGEPLFFYAAPGVNSRRVLSVMKTDIYDESRWPEYYDWLTERIIRMREVMGKRL